MIKRFILLSTILLLVIPSLTAAQATQESQTAQPANEGFGMFPKNPNAIKPYVLMYEVKPGETINDTLILKNSSSLKKHFIIYASDGEKTNQGDFTAKTIDKKMEEVGKWTELEITQKDLNPSENIQIPFKINIPGDIPIGTYEGGISAQTSKPSEDMPSIQIANRYITKVSLKVTADPQPIPKLNQAQANVLNVSPTLWASIGIFTTSMAYFVYGSIKERKLAKSKIQLEKDSK